MDMNFINEYYECVRGDCMGDLAKQHSDKWELCEKELKDAWNSLLAGLGLTHLFGKKHELSAEEKRIWKLFFDLDCAAAEMACALLKGAYMVGVEDRDRMLR